MTLEDRIKEAETKYNDLQNQRQKHITEAETILTEMTKLQGEYRVLKEMLDADDTPTGVEPSVLIEGEPKKKGKK